MNHNLTNQRRSRLSQAITAAAGTLLLAAAGAASAQESNLVLQYECPLPILGNTIITADISATIPAEEAVGDSAPFDIVAITTVPDNVPLGLGLAGAVTITGNAIASSAVDTVARDIPVEAVLEIPETPVGTEIFAEGTAPSVPLLQEDVGPARILVNELRLEMQAFDANGNLAPDPVGEFTSDCVQLPDQNNVLHEFDIIGEPPLEPVIELNPEAIDFGTVQAGIPQESTFTVRNRGGDGLGGGLSISNIFIDGEDAASFDQNNNCNTLASGETCTVNVTYFPDGNSPQGASVVVESNDPENPAKEVPLSGNPVEVVLPQISVDPEALDFGIVAPGAMEDLEITVSNSGGEDLMIEGISISGPNADDFTSVDDCTTLNDTQQCTITVTYFSSSDEAREATLTIASNDEETPQLAIPLNSRAKPVNGGTLEVIQTLEGETFIASSSGTLPLSGFIDATLELASATFEADLVLEPTQGTFGISDFFLFRGLNATAKVEFVALESTTGAIVDNKLNATSVVEVRVKSVDLGLYKLNLFPIGGGDQCKTMDPVTIELNTPEGETFEPLVGGLLEGTYDLPPLENCGFLTDVLNNFMSGPGNTINLELTAQFD